MITDVGGGLVSLDGVVVQPMPGWPGPWRFYETATRYYVGAGQNGGPRVAVYSRATRQKMVPDFFAGDPTSRAGVLFVETADDPITFGAGFCVYLLFERDFGGSWKWDVTKRVADLFAGCGIMVTTRRPVARPGDYGVCVTGDSSAWFPGEAGVAPTNTWGQTPGGFVPQQVYASALTDPLATAAMVAHECGHGFGLVHVNTPNSIMQPNAMPGGSFDDGLKALIRLRTAPYSGSNR